MWIAEMGARTIPSHPLLVCEGHGTRNKRGGGGNRQVVEEQVEV